MRTREAATVCIHGKLSGAGLLVAPVADKRCLTETPRLSTRYARQWVGLALTAHDLLTLAAQQS
jgi:hypothetical protein